MNFGKIEPGRCNFHRECGKNIVMRNDTDRKKEKDRKKRFEELASQSEANFAYYFTDFLSPSSAALAYDVVPERMVSAWGGAEGCERVILRFGNPDDFGYEEAFPIKCIQIEPLQAKFSDALTHRDFLGALMNLGIERDTLGDVIVRDNRAWVFALPHIAELILHELYQVKHTNITCKVVETLPPEAAFRLEETETIVPSLRIDAVLAKLCHLSRGKAKDLISSGNVLINGRLCTNDTCTPKEDDVIVVRGHGKYIFRGEVRQTGKGNLVVRVDRYV